MARLTSELVLSLRDRVSGPARQVGGALDALDRKTKHMAHDRSTAQAFAAMGEGARAAALATAGVAAGAGAALGAKATVVAAADFESALTNIQKKAGTTAEETARLGEEIKALAVSGRLAVPIEEILGAYERGAAAGIPIKELAQFAELSVKAADAFEMPAEEVGNFAAKLKTSMGLSEDAIRRVFDLTNSLADAGIADESAIVDFVDRTGASLKSLGLSVNETLALGSTLLNIGMSSEVASTAMDALSNKMSTVGTLTGKSRKTFEKFMGPVEDFSKMVGKDANGALLTLLDRLKAMPNANRMEFLSSFVGQDHSGKVLRLSDAVEELRSNLGLANDEARWFGSLDTAYKLKLDDFWPQWQLVKNALQKLAIDTGTMGMPAFKSALDGALSIIAEVDRGMKAFRAEVDTSEVTRAIGAVAELGGKIGEILALGGTGDTPVMKFFTRLADTANVVASGMNVARDVLQSVGLASPDADTPKDRQARRDGLVDSYENFNPYLGPLIRRYRDWANSGATEANSTADEARDRSMADFGSGTGLPSDPRAAAPAERGGRAHQPDPARFGGEAPAAAPAPSGDLAASLDALAGTIREREARRASAGPAGLSSAGVPSPSPRPVPPAGGAPAVPNVPIPTPRPEIERVVREEGERAAAAAETAGARIAAAFEVTGRPTVDSSSIRAATADAERLSRVLAGIPGLARQARLATTSAAQSALRAQEDYDVLQADIED